MKISATRPKRQKIHWYRHKDLVAEVSKLLNLPQDEGAKIIEVIVKLTVEQIRRDKIVTISKFGRFTSIIRKRQRSFQGMIAAKKNRVTFVPARELRSVIEHNPHFRLKEHGYLVCRKIKRLTESGDMRKVQYFKKLLRNYLQDKPSIEKWLSEHNHLPWPYTERIIQDDAQT